MGITKTLGGNRLGSGNRMKQRMHGYYRSNHNLSKAFKSSLAPGVLYPCYCNVGLNGDTFDIDTSAFIRTIPTKAPLFGSFKLQIDFFQVPIRLYNAILHDNAIEIGMKMNQVFLPKIELSEDVNPAQYYAEGEIKQQIADNALLKYFGISGIGKPYNNHTNNTYEIKRKFNAVPILAYYDIFKNYYSNKQEDNAYVISSDIEETYQYATDVIFSTYGNNEIFASLVTPTEGEYDYNSSDNPIPYKIIIKGKNLNPEDIQIRIATDDDGIIFNQKINNLNTLWYANTTKNEITINIPSLYQRYGYLYTVNIPPSDTEYQNDLQLIPFELKNIDEMRRRILTTWGLGEELVIDQDEELLPYSILTNKLANGKSRNLSPMNGLLVKTYQSDMFNNWLNKEWIDGLNGINQTTAISTESGSFTIDTLNLAKKLYDYLNRVAISGGTYEDWQVATWGDEVIQRAEKPIYCGGYSSEVMFEEVVSTAATTDSPLGTMGGRGMLNERTRKGGKVIIKCKEPSFIIGILSLTPRISYTQGNKWFMTELNSLDDLHKPALDQIGFQDAMTEQLAWWDATVTDNGLQSRTAYGKVPAWLNYMTDVDECYGDFASDKRKSFMVLTRDYEKDNNGNVKDLTTYIDPKKFNYAFADAERSAQTFWAFVQFNIHARRKMSAKQIPNL